MSSDNTREVSKEEVLHLDNLKHFLHKHNLINNIKSGIETRRFSGGFVRDFRWNFAAFQL